MFDGGTSVPRSVRLALLEKRFDEKVEEIKYRLHNGATDQLAREEMWRALASMSYVCLLLSDLLFNLNQKDYDDTKEVSTPIPNPSPVNGSV